MYKTIDFSDFVNAFDAMGRRDNFSLYGLKAMFEWIEDYETDAGESVELDVIALCCEWNEESPEDILANNPDILESLKEEDADFNDADEVQEAVTEALEHETGAAMALDNGKILYVAF